MARLGLESKLLRLPDGPFEQNGCEPDPPRSGRFPLPTILKMNYDPVCALVWIAGGSPKVADCRL